MSYRKVLERIEAMPVKRLIAFAYSRDGDVCVIGASVLHPEELQSIAVFPSTSGSMSIANIEALAETNRVALEMILETGMSIEEADDIQAVNDGFVSETREEKYVRVHRRLKAAVEKENARGRS